MGERLSNVYYVSKCFLDNTVPKLQKLKHFNMLVRIDLG